MAADSGGQDRTLHAYGVSLVREAQAALAELRAYSDSLPGAELLPGGENADDAAGLPRILNLDPHSHVEAFYDYFNPVINPLRPVVGPGPTRWP